MLHGDPARKIPACVHCHGAALTGVAPAMPGLLGLPRDYLIGAARRLADRQAARRAARLHGADRAAADAEDIGAVAAWLAAQPMPAQREAGRRRCPLPLPMPCGSGSKEPHDERRA